MKSYPRVLATTILSDEAKILVMSGTHGTEDGVSALTDIDRNDVTEGYGFYQEDCTKVGIKAGPFRSEQRTLERLWESISL